MSLRFSRVTLYSDGKTTSFLVGGIPTCRQDLQGWTAFESLLRETGRYHTVNAHVESFLYGGEEPVDATPEEVAYIYKRIRMRPGFIESRTEKIGETNFEIIKLEV